MVIYHFFSPDTYLLVCQKQKTAETSHLFFYRPRGDFAPQEKSCNHG